MNRIGIFGGSFNPVHSGHLIVAQEAMEEARLDRLIWIPAARPPHKSAPLELPGAFRVRLLDAALAGLPGMEVDGRELDRAGPSWTVLSLREIEAENPGADLHLLLGEDALHDLHRWREVDEILARAHLLVLRRPDAVPLAAAPVLTRPAARVTWAHTTQVAISATQVRLRLQAGLGLRGFVPEAVEELLRTLSLPAAPRPGSVPAPPPGRP
jgi:nicotinate-nucleotide adenylyltransferase